MTSEHALLQAVMASERTWEPKSEHALLLGVMVLERVSEQKSVMRLGNVLLQAVAESGQTSGPGSEQGSE